MRTRQTTTRNLEVECLEDRNQPSSLTRPITLATSEIASSVWQRPFDQHAQLTLSKGIIDTASWREGLRINHNETIVGR